MTSAEVLIRYFAELERLSIPYVVLHSYETLPDRVESDVDLCVAEARLADALACRDRVASEAGWLVTQTFQHEIPAFYNVLADPQNPDQYLKLDVCSHYFVRGRLFLRDTDLLHRPQRFRSFYVPCASSECLYVLVKMFLKRKDPAPFRERLSRLQALDPDRAQQLFARVFGPNAGQLRDWLARPVADWQALGRMLLARNPRTPWQIAAEWRRRFRRLAEPTGCSIAFVASNDAARSALLHAVQPLLVPHFRRQMVLRFVPQRDAAEARTAIPAPARPPRGTLMSWTKVLYYFARGWAHWLARQVPARIHSTCILFDQTFDDLLVDARQYRLQRITPAVKMLRRLLPRPDLIFVLDAPAGIIPNREPGVALQQPERQRAILRELAGSDPRVVIIQTTAAVPEVAREVYRHVIQWLAARYRNRMAFKAPTEQTVAAQNDWPRVGRL
jgi:hypothetical protein